MKATILLVEDDPHISKFVTMELEHEGYEIEHVVSGLEALKSVGARIPELVILDVMLPEMDGFRVLEEIRENYGNSLPVIMLTAKGDLKDRVKGLKAGADDYIPKPFEIEELLARIEAVLRRKGITEKISFNDITLDAAGREVRIKDDTLIDLSKTEFELLWTLMSNAGIVMSKDRLLEKVWGTEDWGNPNVVEVYINYLRKKLGDQGSCIKTVRGVGYVIK